MASKEYKEKAKLEKYQKQQQVREAIFERLIDILPVKEGQKFIQSCRKVDCINVFANSWRVNFWAKRKMVYSVFLTYSEDEGISYCNPTFEEMFNV